jgi:hypothetical protein
MSSDEAGGYHERRNKTDESRPESQEKYAPQFCRH